MSKLSVSLGSLPILAVEIVGGTRRIGRSSDNDIVLPLPDVADRHAVLSVAGIKCTVQAMPGEWVQFRGRSVAQAVLGSGDRVGLGGYQLEWIGDDAAMGSAGAEADLAKARSHGTKPLEVSATDVRPATQLEVVEGAGNGSKMPLVATISSVGRSPECDLILDDESVSWRHCSIELTREGIRIRDLGSRNGTFLDGRQVETALAGAGSTIRVGATILRFKGDGETAEMASEGLAELVGDSVVMEAVYGQIREAAATKIPVLVSGETGTGKELVARAIHSVGGRSSGPFVPINCAAIPRDMLEDELFGHVKGAFTGASSDRQGAFERADGGTILLDEVSELALELQAKLLRVLEDGEVPRLGGETVSCDFRIVAATNRDLAQVSADGGFRQDLFFRLAVTEISIPPLRERLGDIGALSAHFLASAETQEGLGGAGGISLGDEILAKLDEHSWPGNVRELRNFILRLAVAARTHAVDEALVDRLLSQSSPAGEVRLPEETTLEQMEQEVIRRTLEDCGGQKRAAARRLGIAESTLYEKIRRYSLQ